MGTAERRAARGGARLTLTRTLTRTRTRTLTRTLTLALPLTLTLTLTLTRCDENCIAERWGGLGEGKCRGGVETGVVGCVCKQVRVRGG